MWKNFWPVLSFLLMKLASQKPKVTSTYDWASDAFDRLKELISVSARSTAILNLCLTRTQFAPTLGALFIVQGAPLSVPTCTEWRCWPCILACKVVSWGSNGFRLANERALLLRFAIMEVYLRPLIKNSQLERVRVDEWATWTKVQRNSEHQRIVP